MKLSKKRYIILHKYQCGRNDSNNGKYYNKQFIKGLMEMTHQGYVSSTNVLNELKSFVNVREV